MFLDVNADNCHVFASDWPRPGPDLVAAFQRFPAANVGDALNRLGLMGCAISAQWRGARCVGPAFTVMTREGDNLAIHRALDEVMAGDVLVINGLACETRAVFGDLLAEICLTRGLAGVVIDGATRDVEAIGDLGLPLWARATTPAGPTKNGPGVIGGTIACGGVVVNPGDLVVADGDGVAVVPRAGIQQTLDKLATIERFEADLRTRVRGDTALQR